MSNKEKRLPFWSSCLNDKYGKGYCNSFVQIGSDLLFCDVFNRLSFSSRHLYLCMVAEAKGKRDFIFPHATYIKIMSNGTFDNSRAELIQQGFIELVRGNKNLRKPAEYRFSANWKNNITHADCVRCGRDCRNKR